MHPRYLALLCTVLLVSCSGAVKSGLTFDTSSMVVRNLNYKDAKVCAGEELFAGFPVSIRYHSDSIILVTELKSQHLVNAIDLKEGSATQYISKGRGPRELLNARDITIDNGSVWVSSISDGRVARLSYDSINREFYFDQVLDLSKSSFMRALSFKNGDFLIQSSPTSSRRFEVIDDSCNVLSYSEYFPEVDGCQRGQSANNAFLQSEIAISPNGRRLVAVTKSFHEIDIYNDSLQVIKKLKGPIEVDCKFETVSTSFGQRYKQDPFYLMYESIRAADQGFFVSYTGCKVADESDLKNYPKNIFSFDWDGTPLLNYCCDVAVMSFDVDPSGHKLYCLIHEPEMQIIVFDI